MLVLFCIDRFLFIVGEQVQLLFITAPHGFTADGARRAWQGGLWVGHGAGAQLMGHLELGAACPAAGLVRALQKRHPQEDMDALAGADPHPAAAVRADQLIGTAHDFSFGTGYRARPRPLVRRAALRSAVLASHSAACAMLSRPCC